jgi:hypothetical protein
VSLDTDGVLDSIEQNNPAITAVKVYLRRFDEDEKELANAGKIIGKNNRCLRFLDLQLHVDRTFNPAAVETFLEGLVLNRSIHALKISLTFISEDGNENELKSFFKQVFKALLPLL